MTPSETETSAGASSTEQLYKKLESPRQLFLDRARAAAKLTLPMLIPEEGTSSATKFVTPWQSIGARGVNNIASKLLLALFPPNSPFFRARIDDEELTALAEAEPDAKLAIEEAMSKLEQLVQRETELQAIRPSLNEALKHLIVAGNILLYLPPAGGITVYPISRYVVRRDYSGTVLEIITQEFVAPETLPPELQNMTAGSARSGTEDKTVGIYTHARLVSNRIVTHQEIGGQVVPGSEGIYPVDESPYIALRLNKIDGEDYGRGFIEEYYGDLKTLEALTKAIAEGSAAAAKVLFLIRPGGVTKAKTLQDAPNGSIRTGDADDVTTLQSNKVNDLRVASEFAGRVEQRLATAFLMHSSIQRNAERVTAEEIRFMAQEIESGLGGTYSILSQELQLPYVRREIARMTKAGKLPQLPSGKLVPQITTGLEALGRGNDLQKLDLFLGKIVQIGPDLILPRLNVDDLIKRTATAVGIDPSGLVKTEEEVQAEQQQQMMMQMAQQAAPGLIQETAGAIRDQGKAQ